ncbi:MAG: hypothetical protein WBQ29_17570 [Isosphaeraceae bacterium]
MAHGPGLLHQDGERGLEGMLSLVRIGERPATNPPDHQPVPLHQRRERHLGAFLVASHKPFQELPIGQVTERTDLEQGTNLPQDGCSPFFLPLHGSTSPSHSADRLAE